MALRKGARRSERSQASAVMLVVEDEPGLREMVADNFRFCGYHVLEAGSAGEANTAV